MFPFHISQLDHLRTNPKIVFKEECVHGHTFTIVCYMVSDAELWNDPMARECRGITYDANGNCVGAPFHKFFNVGERPETQPSVLMGLDDSGFVCLDKRDGSMVHPVLVGDEVMFKSKKSFFSDVALYAHDCLTEDMENFIRVCLKNGMSPIFEYTSPQNRVVLDYGDAKLTLLAIRSHQFGAYLNRPGMEMMVAKAGLDVDSIVPSVDMTIRQAIEEIPAMENIEGVVLANYSTGQMYKIKTQWYLNLHHARTDLRERDVAKMVVDETVDDLKSFLSTNGLSLGPVEDIERKVSAGISFVRGSVELAMEIARAEQLDAKGCAIRFKDHPYFGAIMAKFRGKEPNYAQVWEKSSLKYFSLNTIYSTFNHNK